MVFIENTQLPARPVGDKPPLVRLGHVVQKKE